MMKKLKVYLDTSVISYLDQKDAPERMADTQALWKHFEKSEFVICLSRLTLDEIGRCRDEKKNILLDYLEKIAYIELPVTEETDEIARKIIEMKILTQKSYDDCQHIGVAVAHECDCILSWNFKHIVNVKTINGVRAISNLSGYKQLEIWTPSILLESEDFE